MPKYLLMAAAIMAGFAAGCGQQSAATGAAATKNADPGETAKTAPTLIPATLSGGHDTVGEDRGRPVILVASALGVTSDVFRDAFSRVRPAPAGQEPQPAQVQANKSALMDALAKYGVTNNRLDEVSNYYRYPPGDPKLWKHVDAVVKAKVVNGKVTAFVIEKAGAGYTTAPTVSVAGYPDLKAEAILHFGKDLATNGSLDEIKLVATPPKSP